MGKNQYNICSYDLLRQDQDLEYAKQFAKNGMIIFDEIMRVKNRSSDRNKAAKKLRSVASYCVGLTGTPIENNLAEFYEVLNIVSPGFISSYEKFAEMFLERELKTTYGGKTFWVITGEKNLDEFTKLVSPLFIRKEKRECLELPPASTVVRRVELSKEQKRIEKRLLELSREDSTNVLKYFTYARENLISNDLVPNLDRLNQIDVNSLDLWSEETEFIPCKVQEMIEGNISPEEIELTPRLKEIVNIVEESGKEKIIIFSSYVKALELIKRCILEEPCSMIVGGCDIKLEMENFKNKNRVLLLSEAGSEGINLQFCNLLVELNQSWTKSKQSQLRGRIERAGQQNPMTFYELQSNSIVEARVLKILERKDKLSQKILALKAMQ